MKRLIFALFFATALILPAQAKEKANTVIIHPGETVYASFEAKGTKLKLLGFSKEKNDSAQVVLSLLPDEKRPGNVLKVENKFPRDLRYRLEMRSLVRKQHFPRETTPVVAGKLAFEFMPKEADELAASDFKLEK
jgi:hypothetical protein